MGIKIPNGSGGFKDIANMKRYQSGNWVECQFARMYENGSWVDKWVNATPFYIIQNFNLVNPAKMGGWVHNNFYAYVTNVTKNGGRLGITAQQNNNANVAFATATHDHAADDYYWNINPLPFALDKCNKCRIVIDGIGSSKAGSVVVNIGGIEVPHNYNAGTYIIDLGDAVSSYVRIGMIAYATNGQWIEIKELYFYRA